MGMLIGLSGLFLKVRGLGGACKQLKRGRASEIEGVPTRLMYVLG